MAAVKRPLHVLHRFIYETTPFFQNGFRQHMAPGNGAFTPFNDIVAALSSGADRSPGSRGPVKKQGSSLIKKRNSLPFLKRVYAKRVRAQKTVHAPDPNNKTITQKRKTKKPVFHSRATPPPYPASQNAGTSRRAKTGLHQDNPAARNALPPDTAAPKRRSILSR